MPKPTTRSVLNLSAVAAKRRWSLADAAEIVDAMQRSGEPAHAFAARHGLQVARLRRWLGARPIVRAEAPVRFAELSLAHPEQASGAARIEVRGDGVELVVIDTARCSADWIAGVVAALRSGA